MTTPQAATDYATDIVKNACRQYNNDASRMMDILWCVQDALGGIDTDAMTVIAQQTSGYRVEVEGVVSFYSFFSSQPRPQVVRIYLCEDVIDQHAGIAEVAAVFERTLGIRIGQTSADIPVELHWTPCIGLSDQAPAALINFRPFTRLTPDKAEALARAILAGIAVHELPIGEGEGNNSKPLINVEVANNLRLPGAVYFAPHRPLSGLDNAGRLSPAQVRHEIRQAGLRGRGGAGYPVWKKWEAAATTASERRFVICNADEGEPGTFKDRLLLTEKADLLFEGMTIAAYAVGASEGILYLRAEYRYLHAWLNHLLLERRRQGLLGKAIRGMENFDFDIRIQLGAGAYICGEESALISSCEGRRGEPKTKPPFPAQAGYLGYPTVVNNVETLCAIPAILSRGSQWFAGLGTEQSSGTKLLSVSGDCSRPGVYEVPLGISVKEVLTLAGGVDAQAVQVGGASGEMIGVADFGRSLCFEDLPTAGAIMIFNGQRNLLSIVHYFMRFFVDESCGYCTPCRVGNVFLLQAVEKIMKGLGEAQDIESMRQLSETIIATSRCGLGHTSPNPVLSSLKHFPLVYSSLIRENAKGMQAGFDLEQALATARAIVRRPAEVLQCEVRLQPADAHASDRLTGVLAYPLIARSGLDDYTVPKVDSTDDPSAHQEDAES
ncbi:MAG: NAD(P)H-dependent oxidoreductase subunit E [Hahellaceae bacterium]|nr:NAD(P)H-dependent oxidoreductase subunit E [Hahellaceae bacterium]